MEKQICIHCFVSGRVQGVWYRASTQEEAKRLGLKGWAKNLPDGRVEVMACGNGEAVAELYEWLKKGPPLAVVAEVTYEELAWKDYERFSVG